MKTEYVLLIVSMAMLGGPLGRLAWMARRSHQDRKRLADKDRAAQIAEKWGQEFKNDYASGSSSIKGAIICAIYDYENHRGSPAEYNLQDIADEIAAAKKPLSGCRLANGAGTPPVEQIRQIMREQGMDYFMAELYAQGLNAGNKDKERLDWVLEKGMCGAPGKWNLLKCERPILRLYDREDIDAAIARAALAKAKGL